MSAKTQIPCANLNIISLLVEVSGAIIASPFLQTQPGRESYAAILLRYFDGGAALVATSQCSAILPLSMRNMSNQVVVYFCPLFAGSFSSRTNDNVTKLPSAWIATRPGSVSCTGCGPPGILEKYALNPAMPVSAFGLCWM